MNYRKLTCGILLLLLVVSCPCITNASHVRDLPNSQNGRFSGLGVIPPICEENGNTLAFLSEPLINVPITLSGIDSTGATFTVSITPEDFGVWECVNGQPRISPQPTTQHHTTLQVVVTETGSGQAPVLNSLMVSVPLSDPSFLYFDNNGFMPLGTSSPYAFDGNGNFLNVAQASPVAGADGDATVWSFGLITDPDSGVFFGLQSWDANGIELTNCQPTMYEGCGLAAILVADGFASENGLPLNANGYGITVIDSQGALISLGLTSPSGISAAGHDLLPHAIPVTNGTSPAIYNVSGNYPLETLTGTQFFPPDTGPSDFPAPGPCAPPPPSNLAFRSVWFDFTAQASGQETITTFESHYDTILAVFTGPDVNHLTLIQDINGNPGCNDDLDSHHVQSQLSFNASQGTTYHVLVTEFPPFAGSIATSDPLGGLDVACAPTSFLCASPLSSDSTLYFMITNQQQRPAPAGSTGGNGAVAASAVDGMPSLLPTSHYSVPQRLNSSTSAASRIRSRLPLATNVPVGNNPNAVAVNATTNTIFVTSLGSQTVTMINGQTLATQPIITGGVTTAIAVNSVTNNIYTADALSDSVTVIDGTTLGTSTVNAGTFPVAIAVNSSTNKIYVANQLGDTVTVIDGATLSTTTVSVGVYPAALAINQATNKIYVVNQCGADTTCQSNSGTVTVIDGRTNSTATVNVGTGPDAIAINATTNKIYVSNQSGNNVTVIDGSTLSAANITVGNSPYAIAVDAVTNNIYVGNVNDGTVTLINGENNSTTSVQVGDNPYAVVVDAVTNEIYVANGGDGTVTVIDGTNNSTVTVGADNFPVALAVNTATNTIFVANEFSSDVSVIGGVSAAPLQFVSTTPCRLVDTRPQNGGNGPIQAGTSESFTFPQLGGCNIPTTAAAYSLNVTVIPQGSLGYLTIWPTGEDQPVVSTINSLDGRIKANAAIVPAGYQDAASVYVSDTTNVVIDIDGYFTTPGDTLQFYPLAPCRVLDTRTANGPLGGPYLQSGQERDFPVLSSDCQIPGSAQAYSMNFTVVPYNGEPLGYLTVWPQGNNRPAVSTLNNLTATIVANAAIVPAGTSGGIAAYPSGNTQLVADIDGYFAAPGQGGGLSLYPAAPCRVLDTRKGEGAFSGELTVDVVNSVCAPPSTVQAYVFNATVVPQPTLGFLTLWPDGENRPVVSTLNAIDGMITSNMAIVPTMNGSVDAFASNLTQLVLDISSYFAP